ncbi:MAG: hypothetical protein P4L84_30265 [Isosphaeraceae bacterium]|nr:hypothetical protein [Isosphaeraceae bacterium]
MSVDRTEGRRANHRAFRPTLQGRLEPRLLLAKGGLPGQIFLANPSLGFAYEHNNPPHIKDAPPTHLTNPLKPHFAADTGQNGQKVRIFMNGGVWDITLSEYAPAIEAGGTAAEAASSSSATVPAHTQAAGTVRAYPMGNGEVGIIVDGSTALTDLTINQVAFPGRQGYAHSFAYAYAARPRILNIGAIDVTSGVIGAIEGFHTAVLSGPISVNGTTTVDRIALDAINPGASINVGGTLNTLDVYNGINLTGNGSITVGGNLNLMNVGQSVDLSNGSSITVDGTLALLPQPAKGTGTGSNILTLNQSSLSGTLTTTTGIPNVAAYIQGSLNVGTGSKFTVKHGIEAGSILFVGGNVTGGTGLYVSIPGLNPNPPATSYLIPPVTPPAVPENFVVTGTYNP